MAKLLKLRRGTTTQHGSFTGAEGEVTIDTTKDTAVVHDGSTAGGTPLAKEDMSNVSSASIAGRLGADAIATTKIAGGALPTDVTVASANIVNGTIVNADIASNAAIAGTKLENSGVTAGSYGSSSAIPILTVDAQGLVTGASTTAVDSTKIQNGTTEVATASSGDITMKRSGTTRLVVDNAGVDVTGNINATGNIEISSAAPSLYFTEGDANPDYQLLVNSGNFRVYDVTNTTNRLVVNTDGHVDIPGNLDCGAGIDVTGAIIGDRASFKDDGTAGPTVLISTDDNSPWALAIGNDTYSTQEHKGLMFYQNNDGTMYQHYRGIGSFEPIYFQTSNNTTTNNFLEVDTSRAVHLRHQNVTKLSTTSSGVTVSGTVTADGISFLPSGTAMLFAQSSAPTGWTKSTTHNNKALRVVSGTAGSGGSNAFSNTFASKGINANAGNATQGGNVSVSVGNSTAGGNVSVSVGNSTAGGNISVGNTTAGGNVSISNTSTGGTVNSHTLSTNQMPSHNHSTPTTLRGTNRTNGNGTGEFTSHSPGYGTGRSNSTGSSPTNSTGGNGGHSHGFSGSSHNHNGTLSGTAHNHNASFSGSAHNHNANASFSGSAHNHNANASFTGSAHNHSISVGNLDMSVQYVDVIIATKN